VNAGPYGDLARDLANTPFASIEYREATGSTNADAAHVLGDARFAGHTIVAEYQHHGAGRKGRAWEAPRGTSLLFTTILPHAFPADRLWVVPFWAALAVEEALRGFGIAVLLQWPNDVLRDDGKLAGILCLSQVTADRARAACGIGINVRRGDSEVAGAAYCADAAPVERPALLAAILRRFAETLPRLERPSQIVTRWEAAAGLPTARYRIALDGSGPTFEATALALEPGGSLRVRRDDGIVASVDMADVRILR
jgi:BirA family biotin operon repressor/biotin-[acetyl-CoA-carboxylase] ligase